MDFKEAYRAMRNGEKIVHESRPDNYWAWENDTIMLHSLDGLCYSIQDVLDIGFYFDMIVEGSWSILDD